VTPSTARTQGMRQHRRTVSEDKHKAVRATVQRCVISGVVISAAALARQAGVTETFLYRHDAQPCGVCHSTLGAGPISYYRAQIEHIADARDTRDERDGRLTAASTQAELANYRATNQRLRRQIHALETRLGEHLGTQSQASMSELARLAQDVDPASEQRIRALSDRVQALTEQAADQDEELEAVRRLNADLTRRLNNSTARRGDGAVK
jgi:hypothetical protein